MEAVRVVSDTLTPALNKLRDSLADPSPVMRDIANLMDRSFKANLRAQGRPRKWEALKPSTVNAPATKKARRGSGHILVDTGVHIKMAVQTRSTRYSAEIGAPGVIPSVHQVGTRFVRRGFSAKPGKTLRWYGASGQPVFAKSVGPATIRIPPRPFIGRSDNLSPKTQLLLLREDEDAIEKAIDHHIMRGQT